MLLDLVKLSHHQGRFGQDRKCVDRSIKRCQMLTFWIYAVWQPVRKVHSRHASLPLTRWKYWYLPMSKIICMYDTVQASSRGMKLKVTPCAGAQQLYDLKGCKHLTNTKWCLISVPAYMLSEIMSRLLYWSFAKWKIKAFYYQCCSLDPLMEWIESWTTAHFVAHSGASTN